MTRKVLLVGSGITAAVTAALLRKEASDRISLAIWDKARGSGGRMGTSYTQQVPNCTADLGAQFISVLPENYVKNRDIYEDLLENKIIEPMDACAFSGLKDFPTGTRHFVTPNGMGSLVKHFLSLSAPVASKFGERVSSIKQVDGRLQVETTAGMQEDFDIVVLTLPVPQVFQLAGDVPALLDSQPELKSGLEMVKFNSRFALALFYGKQVHLPEQWSAKFFDDSPIRYVAIDNRKRNRPQEATAAILHTTIGYALDKLEKSLPEMEPILYAEYEKLLGKTWPKPVATKTHKWLYSQVAVPFPGKRSSATILKSPLLIIGGDSFTGSGFDNCIESSRSLTEQVLSFLNE